MGRKILMICTSGTSACTSLPSVQALVKIDAPTEQQILESFSRLDGAQGNIEKRAKAAELIKSPKLYENILESSDFGNEFLFPSAEAQTILRWLNDTICGTVEAVDELRIVMLPSEYKGAILNSNITVLTLNKLTPLLKNIKLKCSCDSSGTMPLPITVGTREEFLSSISNLFAKFDEIIENKNPGEEIIICATGGFKPITGFAMMYAQLHSIPCLYSFEGSSVAYEVMSMPLGYAYSSLDEEINMLKAVHNNTEINKNSLPQWVKDSESMAGVLLKSYEKAREKPYGTGEELFRRLRECDGGSEWSDYLQELLVSRWGELWLGDQIPETVEHSRRHSKRLMELGANLFRCVGDKIEKIGFTKKDPRPLALLIAAIYLHDIGHTALSYPVSIKNNDENLFPLGLFPSAVRELHHLLTGAVLNSDPERYFMNEKYKEKAALLSKYVPLIAAHHRGYTTLKHGDENKLSEDDRVRKAGNLILGVEKFNETLNPLEDRVINADIPVENLLYVTALLRVLDGCDVQSDRVISQHYLNYRNQRSSDEANLIRAKMMSCIHQLPPELQKEVKLIASQIPDEEIKQCCKRIYSKVFDSLAVLKEQYETWRNVQGYALSEFMALSLANRLAFKLEQHLHFKKHQSVGFVLPVMNEEKNLVSIKIFPNEIAGDTKILEDIIKDIDGEYKKVQHVLKDFPAMKAELAEVL